MKSTAERGYDAAHKRERRRWEPIVEAGGAKCVFCDRLIDPKGPWDLDHDEDRTGWRGPAHVKCNRSAGQANAMASRRTQTWEW